MMLFYKTRSRALINILLIFVSLRMLDQAQTMIEYWIGEKGIYFMRTRFEQQLEELRDDILLMGSRVEAELRLALRALDRLDVKLAQQVHAADEQVNAMRFATEEKCFTVLVTQQPAARDLRAVVAVMNMIVDLERMGDQAKGIAKAIPHLARQPNPTPLPELREMGETVAEMLHQSMDAYQADNLALARQVTSRDGEVDRLYAQAFAKLIQRMATESETAIIENSYAFLRVARELERFGDLATNIAERIIYRVTGQLKEINTDSLAAR